MEIEWKNGDECVYKHKPDVTYVFIGMHPVNKKSAICWNKEEGIAQIHVDFISKPETQKQREERERLEAAYDLYCEYTNALSCDARCYSSHAFSNLLVKDKWLAIVDKTKYRK